MNQNIQSTLITFTAIKITHEQNNVLDTMMNFAAVIIVRDLDDYVGKWFKIVNQYHDLILT